MLIQNHPKCLRPVTIMHTQAMMTGWVEKPWIPKIRAPAQLQANSKLSKIPMTGHNNAHPGNDHGLDEIMNSNCGGPNQTSS